MNMRQPAKTKLPFLRGQRGVGLIETMVALGILAAMGVAFLAALNTTSRSTNSIAQKVTAAAVAQSVVEEIRAMPYDASGATYKQVQVALRGYSLSVSDPVLVQANEQRIKVTVSQGGKAVTEMIIIKLNG